MKVKINVDHVIFKNLDGEYHLSLDEFERLGEEKAKAFAESEIDKSLSSESIVARFLRNKGWNVSVSGSELSNGFDLVAVRDGKYIIVEVKTAIKGNRSYLVKAVSDLARNSDYIAIVMPDRKSIHFESMADHLSLCRESDGCRSITKIVRLYE